MMIPGKRNVGRLERIQSEESRFFLFGMLRFQLLLLSLSSTVLTAGSSSESGYFLVDESTNSNLFYWFFPNPDPDAPLILWLNGGPGCSSIAMGLLMENGPWYVADNLTLIPNNNTWATQYHMLYIDQPVGTGFSYTDSDAGYATDETMVATNLYSALTQFFQAYPDLQQNDFYIFGESYAGKYIPSVASLIDELNPTLALPIQLKGFGIGNGLIDPLTQSSGYLAFAVGLGLIDLQQAPMIETMQGQIVEAIQEEEWLKANDLWNNLTLDIMLAAGMPNPADVREFHYPNFNLPMEYLNQPSVLKGLGIPLSVNFSQICNGVVSNYLTEDTMQSVAPQFAQLLDRGYKVILFNGNFDLTVPVQATETFANSLNWSGAAGFLAAQRSVWVENQVTAGFWKQYKNFNQVVVYNAGHMATMDQPYNVLQMVRKFVAQ